VPQPQAQPGRPQSPQSSQDVQPSVPVQPSDCHMPPSVGIGCRGTAEDWIISGGIGI
jgi:hypothetical protein